VLINLKGLYLYYTALDSVRQLGTGWCNLKNLTVMCSYQLKDLSGLSIFPTLQCLFVPHNNIADISDLMYHPILQCVDLEDNQIDSIEQV
jgi:Leucine-rich repeat (LRR) protein